MTSWRKKAHRDRKAGRQRTCAKVTYQTREEAKAALSDLRQKGHQVRRAYRCPTCTKFHVTHESHAGTLTTPSGRGHPR